MVKSNLPNSTFQNCKSANLEENSLERGKEEKVPNVSTTLNKFAIFAQYCKGSKRIPFILVLHKVKVGICIAMPRDNKKSRF